MSNYLLKGESVTKNFGRRIIFENLNFEFSKCGVYGISGPNGSGKSTLMKIISGINSPSIGKIIHSIDDEIIIPEKLHNFIGFVSPYLVLYEEFSAWENLEYFARIRDVSFNKEKIELLLNDFLLINRKDDLVKTYSSGMKQRMKFIFALMHSPELILLDEPTSNLDDEGKDTVYKIIKRESKEGIVVIASNEKSDLAFCKEIVLIEKYKHQNN
ncbi:MAG TPA: ABC transporter ATP-binding protein [Ignavibacteriaceae bacterium]|nr:ABC transporter ATP-binding protein [Ignavibacteriaceae bacterium]